MNDRPWVAAARPSIALLTLAIGNAQPETVAHLIADRLSEGAFEDLIQDIESDAENPLAFMGRFEGYFGLAFPTDDTRTWFIACMQELRAMMEDDEAEEGPADDKD